MPRSTRAQRAAIARRRADIVELRLAGADPLTVGQKLAADPSVNTDRVAYPCGYGHELCAKGRQAPDDETLIRSVNRDDAKGLEHWIAGGSRRTPRTGGRAPGPHVPRRLPQGGPGR